MQRDVAERGQGQGRIVLTEATGGVTATHVERPGEGRFDSPMATRVRQQAHGTGRVIAEGITHLRRGGGADEARSGDAGHALQARPGVLLVQPPHSGRDVAPAPCDSAMAFVAFFVGLESRAGGWLVKEQGDLLVSGALVACEASERGAATVQNLRRTLALAAHRLKRAGRTTQVKKGEEFW
jgi:hypothetical protein